jgi:hypothetical protein
MLLTLAVKIHYDSSESWYVKLYFIGNTVRCHRCKVLKAYSNLWVCTIKAETFYHLACQCKRFVIPALWHCQKVVRIFAFWYKEYMLFMNLIPKAANM